jgi:arginase family enzyme
VNGPRRFHGGSIRHFVSICKRTKAEITPCAAGRPGQSPGWRKWGDHALIDPVLRAVGGYYDGLTVLHFDAHADYYDRLDGDRFSHACPFARGLESGRTARLIQVGIPAATRHQRERRRRFGVEVHEIRPRPWRLPLVFEVPLYVFIGLDILDPAFAPGVPHFKPGGLSTRERIDGLQGLKASLAGADIVTFNPRQGFSGCFAMAAAMLLDAVVDLIIKTEKPAWRRSDRS